MSILQEYEQIRKDLGEERYKRIETFLQLHPELDLSDVYYKAEIWELFTAYETSTLCITDSLKEKL